MKKTYLNHKATLWNRFTSWLMDKMLRSTESIVFKAPKEEMCEDMYKRWRMSNDVYVVSYKRSEVMHDKNSIALVVLYKYITPTNDLK